MTIFRKDDVVIERGKHSVNVKFVEFVDETGILLVGENGDEFFHRDNFELLEKKYTLLCAKEDRKDMIL